MMVNKIASRRRFCSRGALEQSLGWDGKASLGETGICFADTCGIFCHKKGTGPSKNE